MDQQPISREGYDKLREELRRLEDDELPEITQAVADARSEGDLKETPSTTGSASVRG